MRKEEKEQAEKKSLPQRRSKMTFKKDYPRPIQTESPGKSIYLREVRHVSQTSMQTQTEQSLAWKQPRQ